MGKIQQAKDRVLAATARTILNGWKLSEIGRLQHLAICTTAKEIRFTLELEGESEPVKGEVAYRIEVGDDTTELVIGHAKLSRQWMEKLVNDVLPEDKKRIELAGPAFKLAGLL